MPCCNNITCNARASNTEVNETANHHQEIKQDFLSTKVATKKNHDRCAAVLNQSGVRARACAGSLQDRHIANTTRPAACEDPFSSSTTCGHMALQRHPAHSGHTEDKDRTLDNCTTHEEKGTKMQAHQSPTNSACQTVIAARHTVVHGMGSHLSAS